MAAFFLARGAGADAGGAGLFGMTPSLGTTFARHHRAVGRLRSPANPAWELLSSSAGAGQGQNRPMEVGRAAGTSPATTASRDATASCAVTCSECAAEVGATDGSAVEGLDAVGVIPLYADPLLAAGRAIGRASAAQ
eukprot:scaffold123365_cov54-Phaeocystis_antarctica.AAC.1